ncbi:MULTISPECIES: type II toxin-antitoxin system death-on-curing family toxin [unclassified Bacillus (in: firmicutes)]|uniref:type II toxin-antitoxin system death-on-curing family toxin n=1 Tax=unclassified Bacillus (in: firmicutes) TaxID=185979 RepID=UPI001BEAFE3D|nr:MULTISPECIES: type II toxin-antitoxin system death-on-curing family toxin [unclassified Bacillus (in: firmicutes)]MBT2700882.1 type II toxin-antitoxin system death-on-curing family toxin [Bacillus sp. ISL-40]MBT2736091.1 type II toxin-antitoxin system death-on-curing family toxin [Bacillus sp. ISL-7]MBT2740700.1 type II toxin-antitoxin system death-on-curing family toxin [Bacillus sp. ISL-77]
MKFEYLTYEDIIDIHDLALERYGGLQGYDKGCIEAKVAMPQEGFGDFEYYPRLFQKAAVYMYFITINHCFKDGNKRSGYLAASTFLNLNGYRIIVGNEELFNKCIEIADKKSRPILEDVEMWLEKYSEIYDYENDLDV